MNGKELTGYSAAEIAIYMLTGAAYAGIAVAAVAIFLILLWLLSLILPEGEVTARLLLGGFGIA